MVDARGQPGLAQEPLYGRLGCRVISSCEAGDLDDRLARENGLLGAKYQTRRALSYRLSQHELAQLAAKQIFGRKRLLHRGRMLTNLRLLHKLKRRLSGSVYSRIISRPGRRALVGH